MLCQDVLGRADFLIKAISPLDFFQLPRQLVGIVRKRADDAPFLLEPEPAPPPGALCALLIRAEAHYYLPSLRRASTNAASVIARAVLTRTKRSR